MNGWEIAKCVLLILAGLGTMMFGMQVLSDSLTKASGKKLRSALSNITSNRFKGILVGGTVTAVIHSSAATTVMVVSLVNSGILSLVQATSVIMGANIGTTVTGLLLSLKSLPITQLFASFAFIGIILTLSSKKPIVRAISNVLIGFGLLFVGMYVMSASMGKIAEINAVKNVFVNTTNPFILLIVGALLTALMQSSTTMTGILLVLAGSKLVTLSSALYVVLGMNLGTCTTSLIASIGANTNSVRAAVIHFMFNVIGTLLFFVLLLFPAIRHWMVHSVLPSSNIEFAIAVFHVIFNLVTCAILLPLINPFVKLVTKIIPERKLKNEDEQLKLHYIDERILSTPSIAVGECKREVAYMAERAYKNFILSINAITNVNLSQKTDFEQRETKINYLNHEISKFLVKLSSSNLSDDDEKMVATFYHVVSDIERIGDYAENIIEYTQRLIDDKSTFSDAAKAELNEMCANITNLYNYAMQAFNLQDRAALLQAEVYEDATDANKEKLYAAHIERLKQAECTAENGSVFLALISDMERIADHFFNIAKSILHYVKQPKTQTATQHA